MSEQFNFDNVYKQLKELHQDKELSPYEANIFDFVSVIIEQPNLLTQDDRLSLEELLPTLPDDIVGVSNRIAEWYSDRTVIEDAIFDRPTFSASKGIGGRKVKPTPKELKKLVENAVRQSKSDSSSYNSSRSS